MAAPLQSRRLTNRLDDCRVVSLAKLKMASEVSPRDEKGPYLIVQEGYDPADLTMQSYEFFLGRAGGWIASHWFFILPIQERREEFVFGTLVELTEVMDSLAGPVEVIRAKPETKPVDAEEDAEWCRIFLEQTD